MFVAYQLKNLSIEHLADLSNKKRTQISQSDSIKLSALLLPANKSNYMSSILGLSPPAAKAAERGDQNMLLIKAGSEAEATATKSIRSSIKPYMKPDGSVDAGAMMNNWFPDISANVFISHARADKKLALALAGWLMREFGLVAFIDSCVWLHANDLLKDIDNKWCYDTETNTYSYEARNITTAHVHMMLSTSLTKMMDRCECTFFINTENSVSPKSIKQMVSGENESTHSQWLFHEISMMNMLRRESRAKHREEAVRFSKDVTKNAAAELPLFDYPFTIDDLPVLTTDNLNNWLESGTKQNDALDFLYGMCPPPNH